MQYIFHFKLGGSPAPMEVLTAPENQPKYPSPNNIITTTSLQSPTTPIEQFLYHFDQRRHQITEKALKRIKHTQKLKRLFCKLQTQLQSTQHPQKQHRHRTRRTRKKKRRHQSSSSSDTEKSKNSSDGESTSSFSN